MSTPQGEFRWLVVGHRGMLGTDLMRALADRDATGLDLPELDITDPNDVVDRLAGFDVVVNAAAFTGVDAAEDREAEAFAVNAVGPANLARACRATGALVVHVSTDYVFGGSGSAPYQVDAPVAPGTAYGRTKAAGEWAVRAELPDRHWILRTAWLYGAHGASFVRTMARQERERDTVEVVVDQVGQPTWTVDLARRILEVVDHGVPAGTYHATASGQTSWFGFARRIYELLGADPDRVRPTTSDLFVRRAARPAFSVLDHSRWSVAELPPMRDWDSALTEACAVIDWSDPIG